MRALFEYWHLLKKTVFLNETSFKIGFKSVIKWIHRVDVKKGTLSIILRILFCITCNLSIWVFEALPHTGLAKKKIA